MSEKKPAGETETKAGSPNYKVLGAPVVVACMLTGAIAYAQEDGFRPLGAAGIAAQGQQVGQPYDNPAEGFALTLPTGWTVVPTQDPQDTVRVQFYTGDQRFAGTNCNVAVVKNPVWAGFSQDQINGNVNAGMLASSISDEAKEAGQNPQLLAMPVKQIGPLAVQAGEYTIDIPVANGQLLSVYITKFIAGVPGTFYNVNCSTQNQWRTNVASDFDVVLNSFRVTR